MNLATELESLFIAQQNLCAILAPLTERQEIIKLIIACIKGLPVFYMNSGYKEIQKIQLHDEKLHFIPGNSVDNGFNWILNVKKPGVYIIDRRLSALSAGEAWKADLTAVVSNLAFELKEDKAKWIIFIESYIELPLELSSFIPILNCTFPGSAELEQILFTENEENCDVNFSNEDKEKIIRAAKGIFKGELSHLLPRLTLDGKLTAKKLLEYKKQKFRGQGIEFISEPDVPKAAGLENLDEALSRYATLLKPEAMYHNLSFPRGMLLWGIPGTGKSLTAKLAAGKLGVPLIAADWGGVRGNNAYESRRNLKEFLATCDTLGEEGLILYFDDFDKGFSGYNSDADGGISRQLASKLLTWMQEHTSKVLVLATINRLDFLPPELIRRFEENIFFVDLPHAGARYEVFKLHLAKYCPELDFSEKDWRKLLAETHLLTPAEIGNLVKRTAQEAFYENYCNGLDLESTPLNITVNDLIKQRYMFTPSAIRDEDQIISIRNQATFARPSQKPDTSIWAKSTPSLFE